MTKSPESLDTQAELEQPDTPQLLSPQLRAAVRTGLSPSAPDRARVRDAVWSSVASGELSKSALRVEALMHARAAIVGTKLVSGWGIASKLVALGLFAAGAGIAAVSYLHSTPAPLATPPASAAHAPPATTLWAPTTPSHPSEAHAPARAAVSPKANVEPTAAEPTARERKAAARHARVGASVPRARTRSLPIEEPAPSMPNQVTAPERAASTPSVEAAPHATTVTEPAERAARTPAAAGGSAQAPKPQLELTAELLLVRGASDALDHGDAATALRQLQRYTSRYPHGALRVEAAALRAVALCTTRVSGADAARDSFLAAHATSPLAERVKRACASVP